MIGDRVLGTGSFGGGGDDHGLLRRASHREDVLGHRHRAHQRMTKLVLVGLARRDPMIAPQHRELRALHGQLADERGQPPVVGMPPGDDAEIADHGAGLAMPVHIQVANVGVQEQHSRQIRAIRATAGCGRVDVPGQQRMPQRVPGQNVGPSAEDHRGRAAERAHQRAEPFRWRRAPRTGTLGGELPQVRALRGLHGLLGPAEPPAALAACMHRGVGGFRPQRRSGLGTVARPALHGCTTWLLTLGNVSD